MDIAKVLGAVGLVPVVEISDAELAVPLAETLAGAGLACAEITFRTAAAADAISAIATALPDFTVGAGTVLSVDQAKAARDAGASFLVAPGLNPAVVEAAAQLELPMVPGACTPSEVEQAMSLGLTVLKFFPAEAHGGIGYLRALQGPYGAVSFMATGGITAQNLGSYLALKNVVACGGSWIVSRELLAARDFGRIGELTAEAVELVRA